MTKNIENLRQHITKHLINFEKYPYMCRFCKGRGFSKLNLLEVHLKYQHDVGMCFDTNHFDEKY